MDDRDKMQARACIGTAHDYLWDAYRQIREADEYFSDPQLSKTASALLTEMINLLDVERRLNKDEV